MNPNSKIMYDLFLKLADNLTVSGIFYSNLTSDYISINGCLSMLTFCLKLALALGL